jgi:hypothetical protein
VLSALTQHGVRLSLAQQEADDITKGIAEEMHDSVTVSVIITVGLELEQQQHVVNHFF